MPSTRQSARSGSSRPALRGLVHDVPHALPMAAKPSSIDIDSDTSDTPSAPASRGPDGDTMAATATSKWG